MNGDRPAGMPSAEPVDYEVLVDQFQRALIHTLRKHSVADSFLDFWVPDADPVRGIASMVDSARIGGLSAIAIRFRLSTLPSGRLAELKHALAKVCTLTLEVQGDSVLLRATHMTKAAPGGSVRRADRPKPAYWTPAADAGSAASESPAPLRWASTDFPEFSDVHPELRPRLKAAAATLSHEGDAGPPQAGLVRTSGREESITLTLDVEPGTHIVRRARHAGGGSHSARLILELFCKGAQGLPIQEVADHVGLKVLEALVDADGNPPVRGVLLPANAGAPFMLPPRLARQAYDAYRALTGTVQGTNFYYPPPSAKWQSLSPDECREKVTAVLKAFLGAEGLQPDDMSILGIQKNKTGYQVRVVVGFPGRVATERKPDLMRRLERRLRGELEPELDLVADRARDTSPLRRLS